MDLLAHFPLPLTVSVVGTGRGSGKTTVVNALLQEGSQKGIPMGVIAAGKSGNDTPLRVPKGTLVALAKNCELIQILEVQEELPAMTPWGEILVGEARENVEGILGGPVSLRETVWVVRWLREHGAQLIMVDGSLARWSYTDTSLCQRYVLAMGADPSAPVTRKENLERIRSLEMMPVSTLPPPEPLHPAWMQNGMWKLIESLDDLKIADLHPTDVLYWPGALTDDVALRLNRFPVSLSLLLEEPWHMLCGLERWQSLWRGGWSFQTLRKAELSWVAVNPRGSDGSLVDSTLLMAEAKTVFQPLDCFLLS